MNVLELFKGSGSVGKTLKKMKLINKLFSLDCEAKYKPDILTDILEWDYKAFYKDTKFIPNFIWASPPCNTFSPLAYPLGERNTKTAEPISDRAKKGTEILYKTLEIISFFQKLNPKLIFVIENPHGMMRFDAKIKKLIFNSTYYSLYGDARTKPTDFFSNIDLKLKEGYKRGTKLVVDLSLYDRYKIPSKLIRNIIETVKTYL